MDIKFHVTKIIDNGSKIDDWSDLIETLKKQKCDRDLLLQVFTIALNNTKEKENKEYKKLLIGLANLQSETSPDIARQTFQDANNLDGDCAIVCVYFAQFENRQKRKNEATMLLRNGKVDGRSPKFLIKNAYHNLRDNKWNLFEGVPDPWDDSLFDITATATFKTTSHTPNKDSLSMKAKKWTVGKPTRSASNLSKVSKPKSPTSQVKEKLGLVEFSGLEKPHQDGNDVDAHPTRSNTKKVIDEKNFFRPTLSPFLKTNKTPRMIKKSDRSSCSETPVGFVYNIFESGSKLNSRKESFFDKDFGDRVATSINFELDIDDDAGKRPVFTHVNAVEKEMVTEIDSVKKRYKKSPHIEHIPNKPPDKNNQSKESFESCHNEEEAEYHKTPFKDFRLHVKQQTCPRKGAATNFIRRPLTEIKIAQSKSETDAPGISFRKQKLNFDRESSSENSTLSVTQPNINDLSDIFLNDNSQIQHTGLTDLLQSADLIKERTYPNELIKQKNGILNTEHKSVESLVYEKDGSSIDDKEMKEHSFVLHESQCKENLEPANDGLVRDVKPLHQALSSSHDTNARVNQLVKTGLKTFERNGFNMGQKLEPVPKKSKTFFLNGKELMQVKCIGKGGFCKVYEVVDEKGTVFALKKVELEDNDKFMVESHLNEIKFLSSLSGSPFIIQLYDWEHKDDVLLLLMEKGDCDLMKTLNKCDKMPLVKVKEYWGQMLQAVKVVHEQGIVHADLKPANFLLVGKSLKLIDFGISNRLQSNKTSITREFAMGTINYMPPEAILLDSSGAPRISRASDVWSLGCMLYKMVLKRTPYQHLSVYDKPLAIKKGAEISYEGLEDADLLDCLKGCLKFNKRERYTIDELLNHPFLK